MTKKRDPFEKLKTITPQTADADAKARALELAMTAFDAAAEKNSKTSQGNTLGQRLKSIFFQKRTWTMTDLRLPLGVAAAGLLLFPLSMQLMNSTMLDQTRPPVFVEGRSGNEAVTRADDSLVKPVDAAPQGEVKTELADKRDAGGVRERGQEESIGRLVEQEAPSPQAVSEPMAPPAGTANRMVQNSGGGLLSTFSNSNNVAASPKMGAPILADRVAMPGYQQSGDKFAEFDENGFLAVDAAPVSTFSVDVDTASYAYVRRALESGVLPPADAVRVEEMINYFSYDYPAPEDASAPFRQTVSVYPSPWNEDTMLMHVGIKGFVPDAAEAKPANIVLLIDTSGSMNAADKLPLLKRSFGLLLDQLGPDDTVSIVTYAGAAGVVLEPTPASDVRKIRNALERLTPGGSTAGAAGIEAAYRLAEEAARDGSNNRVLLATDGDFNVGISDPNRLKRFIEKKRDDGIFLSVLGFGSGNYNDQIMQTLAQNGNGVAAYIDSFREAQKVLSTQVRGTLDTIAKDVKVQVEFNPAMVAEYRLVGYESRALKREDFNNDKVDAGDIGAGHSVTAIYEFTPLASAERQLDPLRYQSEAARQATPIGDADEYAFLKLRYKLPDEDESRLITEPVSVDAAYDGVAATSEDVRFATAVAGFAQKLKDSQYVDGVSYADIRALAAGARGNDVNGYRAEFLSLVDLGAQLSTLRNR